MIQIRCIEAINGYEVNEIIDVPDDGLSFALRGISGGLVIKNLGEGNRILFVVDDAVDSIDKKVRVQGPDSLHRFFTFDLEDETTVPPVESTRKPAFSVPEYSPYKEFISIGTYDGETRIILSILNNEENYDVEFSTFFHGSLSGIEGNYTPNTWEVIDRETDGTYYLILPSIDDGNPRPFWVRFAGNTVNEFGAFRTFKTNGEEYSGTGGGGGIIIGGGDLVLSPEETLKHWVSWERFANKEVALPAGMDAILGFGSPIYNNDPVGSDGKHIALKIGYTHACNITAYPKYLNRYGEENIYLFTQPFQLIQFAAVQLINQINGGGFPTEYPSGYHNGGVWGNLSALAFPNSGTDYTGITQEGARKLGEYCYYQRSWSLDPSTGGTANQQYNINNNKAWFMLDDEQIPYGAGGIGKMNFLAGINRGMKTVAPNCKTAWYAVPNSFFFQVNQESSAISDSAMQAELLSGATNYNHADFKDYGYWIDSGIYVKVPSISSHNKYKKSGGSFVLNGSGKRIWEDVNFTETIYGEPTLFLGTPDDNIKYLLFRPSDGAGLLGPSYWNGVGTSSPSPKSEYTAQGYVSYGRPNPSDWRPETQYNTEFYYSFANVVLTNLIYNSRIEYGNTDISTYRSGAKCLSYVELRLKTEEFTAKGNSTISRQIGAGLLTYCQLFSYLSGVRAVSLWENGRDYGYNLPDRGTLLYPNEAVGSIQNDLENYSGVTHRTDSLNLLARELAGTTQSNWRYIHFYYPVAIENRYGVIGTGLYTGNKFIFLLINPTLNYDESQTVTITINSVNYNVTLTGSDMPHYGVIRDLATGLTPSNFSLSYTTIYGKNLVLSGVMNGTLSNSILSES